MSKLLDEIGSYWTNRAQGYSNETHTELAGTQRSAWRDLLVSNLPQKSKDELKILDIGTGPGFFSIIMAESGYRVNAVDYTEEMLNCARSNAGDLIDNIEFSQMDAHDLDFRDGTFDMIVTRNLTWVLEDPEKAYKEWGRVLKNGGKLLNFDANWYTFLNDNRKKEAITDHHKKLKESGIYDNYYDGTGIDNEWMEDIAMRVPLTAIERPLWDKQVLTDIGFDHVSLDETVGSRVLSPTELINYEHTPMFMIKATK